jgi:small-conductance mechanosensitive channel
MTIQTENENALLCIKNKKEVKEENSLKDRDPIERWMRSIIQLVSFLIILLLTVALVSIENMEDVGGFSKIIAMILTLLYMIVFVYIAIDPNQARIKSVGSFKSYVSLLGLILIFLLTYFFLIPIIIYLLRSL